MYKDVKSYFHTGSGKKDPSGKDRGHLSHLPVVFKDNFITISRSTLREKEELKKD
jgi:hypothetical protein